MICYLCLIEKTNFEKTTQHLPTITPHPDSRRKHIRGRRIRSQTNIKICHPPTLDVWRDPKFDPFGSPTGRDRRTDSFRQTVVAFRQPSATRQPIWPLGQAPGKSPSQTSRQPAAQPPPGRGSAAWSGALTRRALELQLNSETEL